MYLSPSKQEANPYIIGGSEEYYMNLIADAMEPYLRSSGIAFTRNDPSMTLRQIVNQSNSSYYDLHLALHSNAAPEQFAGQLQGTDVYYFAGSTRAARAAGIIAENFKNIYLYPEKVKAVPTTEIQEVKLTRAPAVLIEIAYHDNLEDAQWISDNIQLIARNLSQSLTQYFNIPFVEPTDIRTGIVVTKYQGLKLRQKPNTASMVLTVIPKGAKVTVYGQTGEWYVVGYNNVIGYAFANYIQV
jgi:N-acetylmuramoyl-L-alanine amidase